MNRESYPPSVNPPEPRGFLKTAAGAALGLAQPVSATRRRALGETGGFAPHTRSHGIHGIAVALGTGRLDDPAIVRYALDHGVNLLDTGRRYQNGRNEEMVAKLLGGTHPASP